MGFQAVSAPSRAPSPASTTCSLGAKNQEPGHFQAHRLPLQAAKLFLPEVRQRTISLSGGRGFSAQPQLQHA